MTTTMMAMGDDNNGAITTSVMTTMVTV